MDTQVLINKLTKAISHAYKDDHTAPGLTISALKKGVYCSVVRYDGAFGKGKSVLCSVKADTLPQALKEITNKFLQLSNRPKDPVQELSELAQSL
jgi:hypothetical protein